MPPHNGLKKYNMQRISQNNTLQHLGKFVDEFDVEKSWPEQVEQREEPITNQQMGVQQTTEQPITDDSETSQATSTQDEMTPAM